MIFRVAFEKQGRYMLKIQLDDNPDNYKWMDTNKEVFNYADKNFEDGDTIGIDYTEKNGQYHVSRVNKEGASKKVVVGTTQKTEVKDSNASTCADCGKELKDNKYEKCYACNKKNPSPKKSYTSSYKRSPEAENSIKMQSAYKVAAMALQVFTGQISDLDTLKEQLDDLAQHIKDRV